MGVGTSVWRLPEYRCLYLCDECTSFTVRKCNVGEFTDKMTFPRTEPCVILFDFELNAI